MRKVIKWLVILAVLVLIVAGVGISAYRYGEARASIARQRAALERAGGPAATRGVTQRVQAVALRMGDIAENLTAYGTVVGKASRIRNVSVPIQTSVKTVLVSAGQKVKAGQALMSVRASPDAVLRLREAQNALAAAKKNLSQVRERYGLKLATVGAMSRARQAAALAGIRVASLGDQVANLDKPLAAPMDGIVASIYVQTGEIVGPGMPLLEIIAGHHIEVRLGVEPGYLPELHKGQLVRLKPVNQTLGQMFSGRIRLLTQRIDPNTRLVDVFVSAPRSVHLVLNDFIRGTIVIAKTKALLVPRQAVQPFRGKWIMYTVRHGHALRHTVRVGLRNDHFAQVIGRGLRAGQLAITQGNYELNNGMAVHAGRVR